MSKLKLKKEQLHVISAVTFGNILEWFEIYSYAYLSPILAKIFFGNGSSKSNLINIFVIFGSAFLIRPFGGIIFGRFGDLVGRKQAFFWSIIIMTIPTFIMGCLPTYSQIGMYAPWLLGFLRLIQAIPAAGEVPGTMCYLYEYADPENRRFMTSWSGVGNQIGAIVAVIETYLLDSYTSSEFMLSWGWRISFWSSGVIGLFGIYLRKTLHETPIFERAKKHHRLDKETVYQVIRNHRKSIILGTAFGAVSGSTFYLVATYLPAYLDSELGLNFISNIVLTLSILFLSTIILPFIGRLGDKWDNKKLLIGSIILIIVLLFPLSYSIENNYGIATLLTAILFIFPISCITALIGYVLAQLFPLPIRFTGVGISFNLADGIVGGFTPAIALCLTQLTGLQSAFCGYIFLSAIISLIATILIRKSLFAINY